MALELPGPVLYLIHCQRNGDDVALPGVVMQATSPTNGPWAGTTDCAGNFAPTLGHGHYSVDFFYHGVLVGHRDWDLAWPPDAPIKVGLDVADVLPPKPARGQVCAVQVSLAGLTYTTQQYGSFPAWFYGKLNASDRLGARAVHRAAGDTHITIPISEAYKEPGTLWPADLADGYDYTQDLATFRAILTETIQAGFFIDVPLAGDGLGAGPGYNDPVGRTYGYQWLMSNLQRILSSLQGLSGEGPDLTPYIIFRPGWDAVFYGWGDPPATRLARPTRLRHMHARLREVGMTLPKPSQAELDSQQQRVKDFGVLFRQLLPNGYLAIEHTPGNIPCGEGGGDYAPGGLMRTYDTIMSEYNTVHEDSCWQVVGRMVSPYNRPADQPAGDDPHPPFYLAPGNERGPYYYVAFEPTKGGIYEWCRGRCTVQDVTNTRTYLRELGCAYTG